MITAEQAVSREGSVGTVRELWLALCTPDVRQQTILLALAQGFSSQVSVEPPDGVLFEAGRSRRFFGGLRALLDRVQASCRQRALAPRWGLAPTPLAAMAFARVASGRIVLQRAQLVGALSPLPLLALGWPETVLGRLAAIGVREIGPALRLPRAGFARRYGRSTLASLDRLLGRQPDPRQRLMPAPRFRLRRELDFELRDTRLILRELQPMLQQLEQFLRRHQLALERLHLQLEHRQRCGLDTPDHSLLSASLVRAASQAEPFARWFAERLARERLPATVKALELRSGVLWPIVADTENLWYPGEHGGALGRESPALIERLRARLGSEAVYGLCLVDEQRPEQAYRVAEPQLATAALAKPAAPPRLQLDVDRSALHKGLRRPLWLLHPPQPLPWCWRELQWLCGPERIETGWWDGRDVMRDYYRALDPEGAEVWVFRERQPPHAWYLHGVFG